MRMRSQLGSQLNAAPQANQQQSLHQQVLHEWEPVSCPLQLSSTVIWPSDSTHTAAPSAMHAARVQWQAVHQLEPVAFLGVHPAGLSRHPFRVQPTRPLLQMQSLHQQ